MSTDTCSGSNVAHCPPIFYIPSYICLHLYSKKEEDEHHEQQRFIKMTIFPHTKGEGPNIQGAYIGYIDF